MQVMIFKTESLQFIPDTELWVQYTDDENTLVTLRTHDSFHDASPPTAIIVSIILPLRLSSIGFPDINVLPLLFTENAFIESFIKC